MRRADTVAPMGLGLLLCLATAASAASSPPMFTRDQEAVLLTTSRIVTAAQHCDGIRIDDRKVSAMLKAAGIAERDMAFKQRSAALKTEQTTFAASFKGHRADVCAAALAEGRREGLAH